MELLTRTMTMTSDVNMPMAVGGGWVDMVPVVGIICGTVVVLLCALGGIAIAFVKAVKGGGSTQKVRQLESQEAEAFMDLQRGFQRMEERIDSLETLLMGRSQSANYDREREFE